MKEISYQVDLKLETKRKGGEVGSKDSAFDRYVGKTVRGTEKKQQKTYNWSKYFSITAF